MIYTPASPFMQIAFVVEDIHESIARWSRDLGVGPFFLQEHASYETFLYRGAPSDPDVSLAFAFSGDLQIELVQQHNDAPSVFRDAIESFGYGAQHLGAMSNDLEAELERFAARKLEPIQRGLSRTGVETVFLPFESTPGGVIELIRASEGLSQAFAGLKAAASVWDGGDPYIR